MNTVTIYGSSDDLIECESDIITLHDEFGHDTGFLFFDDGTIVHVDYTKDGVWKVSKVAGPAEIVSHFNAANADDDEYSDKMVLRGEFKRVECFLNNPPDKEDYDNAISAWLDSNGFDSLSIEQMKRVYAIFKESR